jgi:serine protease Do
MASRNDRRDHFAAATLPSLLLAMWVVATAPARADLSQTIEKVRPSVVAIGTFERTRSPPLRLRGTGFVVGDGLHVVTNTHVTFALLDSERKETLVVVAGRGRNAEPRAAEEIAQDADHDLVLLRIKGAPLPALSIGDPSRVREGQRYAFTGFPIGAVLGLYPVTHSAMISALTPIVIPSMKSRDLDPKVVNRLRNAFEVFQLDATAYPGNSGSPLYDPDTGEVVGIVNMVFVKSTKEKALAEPSGISYAIPASYVRELLRRAATGAQRP